MKGVILLVLDGLGIALPGPGNAYFLANPPHLKSYLQSFPHTQLRASGEAVGLPAQEVGNTEVGHINLGAGRIVYQSLPRINLAIADGTFFTNPALVGAVEHAQKNNSTLHLIGLLGQGSVHASTPHLHAILHLCKEKNFTNVCIHVVTDGRDSPPQAALTYLEDLQNELNRIQLGRIVSVMGRYYAMDRDRRWERVELAYNCLTKSEGPQSPNWRDAVEKSYAQNKIDEFIDPIHIADEQGKVTIVQQNDAVIYYNYRVDRPRELTKAFVLDNFEADANKVSYDPFAVKYLKSHLANEALSAVTPPFKRGQKIPNLYFVTMTEYEKDLPVQVAYSPHVVNVPLGRVISEKGLPQLRVAESEKERFVTYYFNGLRSAPFPLEERMIIPSPKVPTYDLKPEMSAIELTNALLPKIQAEVYPFILVNFANTDMVGHTGSIDAGTLAVKAVDECVGKIVTTGLEKSYTILITADHGNIEEMLDSKTGGISTEHSGNPVPFIAINNDWRGKNVTLQTGILADIAPTILYLLGIDKPTEMTGRNLLHELKEM